MSETFEIDGIPATYDGPTTAEIRKVLKRARHHAYDPKSTSRAGYVVRKPRDVAYVLVTDVAEGMLDLYAETLRAAGYIVTGRRPIGATEPRLSVFKPAP